MRFFLLLPLLLCSCKQIAVLKGNVERTNGKVNSLAHVIHEITKREYEKAPDDIICALNYNDAKKLIQTPLPTQIDLPPVVPAEVVRGGLGLLGNIGTGGAVGGGGLLTAVIAMGGAYLNNRKKNQHLNELGELSPEESRAYLKQKGLA